MRFELTDQTRSAIDDYLRLTGGKPGQVLFCGQDPSRGLTTSSLSDLKPLAARDKVGPVFAAFGILPLARLPRPQTNEADAALFPLHGDHTAIIAGESGLDLAAKTE